MNKTKALLTLLLAVVAIGAAAQVKTFRAPALYGMKAQQAGAPTVMRDSIVSRAADGSLNYKTTYTYDEHGYLTSRLTRRADGTYDTTDQNYFVDYAFDAQGRCTLRSMSRCQPNGQRGEETQRTEARYDYNGYYYYEIRYEWDDGRRYAAEEIGYDQWMNPVYGIGRQYDHGIAATDDAPLIVTYVAHQQFTGRAYAVKEGRLKLLLHHRLVSSVIYDRIGSGSEKYRAEGERRQMVTAGDSVVTTYYELQNAYEVTLDQDLTPYWAPDHQLVWQLNAAHTRPLTMRYKRASDYDVVQGPRKVLRWDDSYDQSLDMAWDDKGRLTRLTFFGYGSSSFDVDCSILFTYADDQAFDVPLSKLLDVEDNDSWEDGGMDDYEGDLMFNWFGRLATTKYADVRYPDDNYTMTVDTWDQAGRMTHAVTSDQEGNYESWLSYREDGKIAQLINQTDVPADGYERADFTYDRWGILTRVTWYFSTSPDGPWEENYESSHFEYSPRKRLWSNRTYEEGNWYVEEYVETDDADPSIILHGQKTKYWQGHRFFFTLDTYRDPRGPLDSGYEEEDLVVEEASMVIYEWNRELGKWVMADFSGSGEAYATRTLDDGTVASEYYRWDKTAEDMVFVSAEYFTLDDRQRVVVRERTQGTDRFTWYADTRWPQQAQWSNGQVDSYYYSQRNYVDPDLLAVDAPKATAPANDAWYSLQGQRLQSRPAVPGVYVHGGRKVVVR